MKKAVMFGVFLALGTSPALSDDAPKKPIPLAATCFKSGEQTSGTNKICFYNCMGNQAAITIAFTDLCPLTIDR